MWRRFGDDQRDGISMGVYSSDLYARLDSLRTIPDDGRGDLAEAVHGTVIGTYYAKLLWHVSGTYVEHGTAVVAYAEQTVLPDDGPPDLGSQVDDFCRDMWRTDLMQAESLREANGQSQDRPPDAGILSTH
jgi:hypothetical protein